ncbi:MAG: acyltransferase [Myxococcales bacterium]
MKGSPRRYWLMDGARGLAALSILVYHLCHWVDLHPALVLDVVLRKLGVYAVEFFYVISGISMGIAYPRLALRFEDFRVFLIRRWFRIAPLYLACSLAVIASAFVLPELRATAWAPWPALANASLLFGLINPALSTINGGWSIGVEFVFYLAFPVLLYAVRRFGTAAVLLSMLPAAVHAFSLDPGHPLASQWSNYVAVSNHVCFFAAGIWISGSGSVGPARAALVGLVGCAAFLGLQPLTLTDNIAYVTGGARLVLSLATCFVAYSLFQLEPRRWSPWAERCARFLGESSYSLYLCHFFVFSVVRRVVPASGVVIALTVVLSLVVSRLLFPLERWCIDLGRRVSQRTRYAVDSAKSLS